MGYEYDGYFWATVFFLILQWLAAIGRCWIRIFVVRRFGIDDVAAIATLFTTTAFDVGMIVIVVWTKSQPAIEIDPDLLFPAVRLTLAVELLYIVSAFLLKIAAALLLKRVLVKRWQILTTYGVIALSIVYGIFFFFFVLFQCGDPAYFDEKIVFGQCLSVRTINGISITHAVLNALCDIALAVLPVAFLWDTNLNKRAKISVGMILGLGSVGCVVTLIRIAWVHYLSKSTNTYFITSRGIALMSAAELSIGITCVCLATYKPLYTRLFGDPFRHTYYTYTEDQYRLSATPNPELAGVMQNMSPASPTEGITSSPEDLERKPQTFLNSDEESWNHTPALEDAKDQYVSYSRPFRRDSE